MRSSILRVILLVAGLSGLAGCATLEKFQGIATVSKTLANCPPIIPILPGVSEQDTVVLYPKDQQALLLYFHQVERCYESAQGIGL